MKGDWNASRIFASELLKDDENDKLSKIEADDTQQLSTQISKKVTQNVLKDFHEDYMILFELQY